MHRAWGTDRRRTLAKMIRIDAYEQNILDAFEKGKLRSVATRSELARLRAAARVTAITDKPVNSRLSSGDLSDIQVLAFQAGKTR